jgi:hypothetical protein
MMKFIAGVLSVIAVGVLAIAYQLLNPQVAVDASALMATPPTYVAPALERRDARVTTNRVAALATPAPTAARRDVSMVEFVPMSTASVPVSEDDGTPRAPRPVRTVTSIPESGRHAEPRGVDRGSKTNWKRTALVIGGSSATGAGVGAIFGGKKGALIGAAIGGGASTIYETVK